MKSKLMLSNIALLLATTVSVNAATIYANDGSEVKTNANICANDSYWYQTDSTNMVEADIVDTSSRMLLSTATAENGEIELSFPSNAEELSVYIYDYTDKGRELTDQFEFKVSDCGYETIVEDYKSIVPKVTVEKNDTAVTLIAPDLQDYQLYVNQIEVNDDGKSKKVKFKNGQADLALESDVIQITEEYTNDKGEVKEQFYEIDLSNDIIVRKLSNLELSIIKPMDYIDRSLLIRVIAGLIALVILCLIKISLTKTYRSKKEYKRQYKENQVKKRQQAKQKHLAKQEAKRARQEQLKQRKIDSEHRANLEIRK